MVLERWAAGMVFSAAALAGCTDIALDGDDSGADALGAVSGRVCSQTGDAWLENAYVYTNVIDAGGGVTGIRETWTDRDGHFVLEGLPASPLTTLYIQKGTYLTTVETEVKQGVLIDLVQPECQDPLSVHAAVLLGEYDSFSSMLDAVGITHYDIVDGTRLESLRAFLLDRDAMLGYHVLCINGGIIEEGVLDDPEVVDNLAAYVAAGGNLFVTDWSYDVVERAFPEAVDFLGDDTVLSDAEWGLADVVADARVVDQALAGYLGRSVVEVRFDLAYWPLIEGASSQVVIHVSGDVQHYAGSTVEALPGAPLLISFSAGYGSVVYSTFREESNLNDDMAEILEYMLYRL